MALTNRSISIVVIWFVKLIRKVYSASSRLKPNAVNTCEASISLEEHAEPSAKQKVSSLSKIALRIYL